MKYYLVMEEMEEDFPYSGTCHYTVPRMMFGTKEEAIEYIKNHPNHYDLHILVITMGADIDRHKRYDIYSEIP